MPNNTPTKPKIECERTHPGLAVRDVAAAVGYYVSRLGFELGFTWGDEFAGVNLGDVQIFLQKGEPSPTGVSISFVVSDADELYDYHVQNGVTVAEPIADRDYGLRDYGVYDLDGYNLAFGHYIYSIGEPIDIEREDVPLRLERRLAALMRELAQYKRMSFDSCMEETLLHALDGVGPHTASQLRHIQGLKQKHGIDYDSHGSYPFREARS